MQHTLVRHPASPCDAVTAITVDASRRGPTLDLRYAVTGAVAGVRWPARTDGTRADELWKHTCFEAFVRSSGAAAYCEFNLSPSTAWAAYGFSGHRAGMRPLQISSPRIAVQNDGARFELRAELDLGGVSDLATDSAWDMALSAVIEETNGRISYWALAHPPGRPDFHHPDCFALRLPPA